MIGEADNLKTTTPVPQPAADATNGSSSVSVRGNERYLVDTGVIQIVLALTAVAFAIRQFIIASDTSLNFVFGGVLFVPIIQVDVLASWVFIVSGVVSTLLFSVYLWEWVDKNFSAQAATTTPVFLRLIALLAYGTFLVLIFLTTISQVMVIP
ncbi:MAG TPA: hypothetical protein VF826_12085 [Chloroflexia bacterium]|jgi:hypothetical protein